MLEAELTRVPELFRFPRTVNVVPLFVTELVESMVTSFNDMLFVAASV